MNTSVYNSNIILYTSLYYNINNVYCVYISGKFYYEYSKFVKTITILLNIQVPN